MSEDQQQRLSESCEWPTEADAAQKSQSIMPPTDQQTRNAQRYQIPFPNVCDHFFAALDDPVIQSVQRLWRWFPLRVAVVLLTTSTAIETALPIPAILYALSLDSSAGLCTSMLIVLAFTTQLFKKFVSRKRPWMTGRAQPFRTDTTSSFPSRAVVCAVVFSWLAFACFVAENSSLSLSYGTVWGIIFAFSVLSGFARVIVGAHYPSDALCGYLIGLLVLKYGFKLETCWSRLGSLSLSKRHVRFIVSSLYLKFSPFDLPDPFLSDANLSNTSVIYSLADLMSSTPYFRLFGSVAASYALTLASITGFWVKCSYVYGLLLSAATFRFVYLCDGQTGVTFPKQKIVHMGFSELLQVSLPFLALLGFGIVTRGKGGRVHVLAFTVIYLGALGALILRRMA